MAHDAAMSDGPSAAQRWHPEGRTAQTWFGAILAVHGLYQAFRGVGGGLSGLVLFHLATVLLGLAVVAAVRNTYVEADRRGLRVARPPRHERVIAWSDVADVRRPQPATSSSRLGVVLRDGEVVTLRLPPDSGDALRERWRSESR